MILDRLENAGLYHSLGPTIKLALDCLCRTDFSQMPDGHCDVDGDNVFASVQRYRLKPPAAARWEAHRRYVDVQYVIKGIEWMACAPLREELAVVQAYDSQKDATFYDARGDLFEVPQGSFVIFTPQDVHATCLASDPLGDLADVCKVVLKCRV